MSAGDWAGIENDNKIVLDPDLHPPSIEHEETALEFRDLLQEHGFWGGGFTDLAALIAVHRPDVIRRLSEDYDADDIIEAKETCTERQDEEHPREILDGLVDDIPVDDLDPEQARELRDRFSKAASESASGDGPSQAFEELLNGTDEE